MNCCYNCQRRHAGCHGQCADYTAYKAELEAICKARSVEIMMRCYKADLSKRVKR